MSIIFFKFIVQNKFINMKTNSLGLEFKKAEIVAAELNILLANFQVFIKI